MSKSVSHQKMAWKNTSRGRLLVRFVVVPSTPSCNHFRILALLYMLHLTCTFFLFLVVSKSEAHKFKGTDLGFDAPAK